MPGLGHGQRTSFNSYFVTLTTKHSTSSSPIERYSTITRMTSSGISLSKKNEFMRRDRALGANEDAFLERRGILIDCNMRWVRNVGLQIRFHPSHWQNVGSRVKSRLQNDDGDRCWCWCKRLQRIARVQPMLAPWTGLCPPKLKL